MEGGLGRIAAIGGAALLAAAGANLLLARHAERRHPARGKFVTVDGVRLHYLEAGAGEPVLLIHGNGAAAEDFASSGLIQRLAADHRVFAFDRPGSGYSGRPRRRRWSVDAQARLLGAALKEVGAGEAVILGHSWGALVALAIGLNFPQATRALVLLSGYYVPERRADIAMMRWAALPVIGELAAWTVLPWLARIFAPFALARIFAPEPVAARFCRGFPLGLAMRPSQANTIARDTALMNPGAASLLSRYRELTMPVVILAGSGDKIVATADQSARLHAILPDSAFRVIAGGGHMIHYTATDTVAGAVRGADAMALSRQERRSRASGRA